MNSIFKLRKNGLCGISVVGLELDSNEYATSEGNLRHYKYEESITLNAIYKVNLDGKETLFKAEIVPHTDSDIYSTQFEEDGLYVVSHIILPTSRHWANSIDSIDNYKYPYYYDEEDGNFKNAENSLQITIEDILGVNADFVDEGKYTTIIRDNKETFCVCKLYECFYRLCRESLTKFCGKCINKLDKNSQEIINRDLLWMAINVITYLVELGQFIEAQRILESLSTCDNNLCKDLTTKKSEGCGCY